MVHVVPGRPQYELVAYVTQLRFFMLEREDAQMTWIALGYTRLCGRGYKEDGNHSPEAGLL